MSSGVCSSCGFPVTRLILYNRNIAPFVRNGYIALGDEGRTRHM